MYDVDMDVMRHTRAYLIDRLMDCQGRHGNNLYPQSNRNSYYSNKIEPLVNHPPSPTPPTTVSTTPEPSTTTTLERKKLSSVFSYFSY